MALSHTREARAERLFAEGVHQFELPGIIEGLRDEPDYRQNGRMGAVLVKTGEMRVVLQAMREGAALAEHQAPGPITVHVLEGEIRFETAGEVIYLREGALLALPAKQRHSVEAVRDSAFLVTIAPLPA